MYSVMKLGISLGDWIWRRGGTGSSEALLSTLIAYLPLWQAWPAGSQGMPVGGWAGIK